MRSSHQKLQDFPGTVIHYGHGLCHACNKYKVRARKRAKDNRSVHRGQAVINGEARLSAEENRKALDTFLARIKKRGPHARVPTPTA